MATMTKPSGYQMYALTGLLVDHRHEIDPALFDKLIHGIHDMTRAEVRELTDVLREWEGIL